MDGTDKSFVLRYVGSRFEGARLPLDVLADLPAFRDLLVAFAKDGWRKSNQARQRLPKGFDRFISFDLVAIEEGSAKPKLDWSRRAAQEMLPGIIDELDTLVRTSYKEIAKLVDGAANNSFPVALSSEHIRALNKLGSGLVDGERIEFQNCVGVDGNVVYLDAHRRKTLITRVRETYQTRYEGVGKLVGVHKDGTIEISTLDHGELRLKIDSTRIKTEFDGCIESDVQFALQIELDNNDKYRSVVDVYDVEIIDSSLSNSLNRIDELKKLELGWHNGDGSPITQVAIDTSQKFLSLRPNLSSIYRIYPTVEGGILFEFEINGWDISTEFKATGQIEIFGVQLGGQDELEPESFDDLESGFMSVFDKFTNSENSK